MRYAQNFHELMILIGDTHNLTHPQRVSLRQWIEEVYRKQPPMSAKGSEPPVSLEALCVVIFRQMNTGLSLDDILALKRYELVKMAREVEYG